MLPAPDLRRQVPPNLLLPLGGPARAGKPKTAFIRAPQVARSALTRRRQSLPARPPSGPHVTHIGPSSWERCAGTVVTPSRAPGAPPRCGTKAHALPSLLLSLSLRLAGNAYSRRSLRPSPSGALRPASRPPRPGLTHTSVSQAHAEVLERGFLRRRPLREEKTVSHHQVGQRPGLRRLRGEGQGGVASLSGVWRGEQRGRVHGVCLSCRSFWPRALQAARRAPGTHSFVGGGPQPA